MQIDTQIYSAHKCMSKCEPFGPNYKSQEIKPYQ